ncbi:MAG: hypothetical protein E7439_03360 [Ruminococcaceae bacterium]|nr:hypothetical protein [Oscillospiraceae bacterium]
MNTLNFNKYRPPILPVEMMDEAGTIIHITPPTVDLQEELRARMPELSALLDGDNDDVRAGFFELAARLMSCNRNMRKITPEQIRDTFRLDEEDLVVFFHAYAEFVTGIENAKN